MLIKSCTADSFFTENSIFEPLSSEMATIIQSQSPTLESEFIVFAKSVRLALFAKVLILAFLTPNDEK